MPVTRADASGVQRRAHDKILPDQDIWLLTHDDLRRTARVQTFMRFIADARLDERELIEGRLDGTPKRG